MTRREDAIGLLMRDLKGCPRFTREQEAKLWRKWRRTLKDKSDHHSGDSALRNQLVLSVAHWGLKLANRYSKLLGGYQEQLASESLYGIIDGLKKFDPAKGRLTTHVRWWIIRRLREFAKSQWLMRVPLTLSKSERCQAAAAIARRPPKDISEAIYTVTTPGVDVLLMEREEMEVAARDVKDKHDRVLLAMQGMDPRQCKILFDRIDGRTLLMIARDLHITRERVRQLETKALNHVRKRYTELYPND